MNKNLEPEERETLINWADDEERIFIYTTQKRIMKQLKDNPLFKMKREIINNNYEKNPLGIEGWLPLKGITIRRSLQTGKHPSSRANLSKKLKNVGDL